MGYKVVTEQSDYIMEENERIFRQEMDQAAECPHFGHINMHTCDGCNLITACSHVLELQSYARS